MRISDWSSDVCSSDLALFVPVVVAAQPVGAADLTGSTHIAAQGPASTQGLGLQVGYNSDYRRATLAYETPKLWVYQFQNGWGRVDLNIELGVSYWEAKRGRSEIGRASCRERVCKYV